MSFSYQVALSDPSNFGGSADGVLVADLDQALGVWSQYIAGIGTLVVDLNIVPTAVGREDGGPTSSVLLGTTSNGTEILEPSSQYELTTGQHVAGTSSDITINISPGYLQYLDLSSGLNYNSQVALNHYNPIVVFLHELMHGFGMTGYYDAHGDPLNGYESTFDTFIQQTPAGTAYFTGPNTEAANGGPAELTTASVTENYYHFGNDLSDAYATPSTVQDPLTLDLMNGIVFFYNYQYPISALDLGVLKDLGYDITDGSNNLSKPSITIDSPVGFKNTTTAKLTGTATDASGLAGVEIFDGLTDLGAATLKPDGTWSYTAHLSAGAHSLSALATNDGGNRAAAAAPFTLQTGIKGEPYSSYEADYDGSGNLVAETYTQNNGVVYKGDSVTTLANGDVLTDYTTGSYFSTQSFAELTDLFDSTQDLLVETTYNLDGTHSIMGQANALKLTSLGNDTMTGGGNRDRFVFTDDPGQETITDFHAAGARHDTISLPHADFASIAAILQSLQQVGNDTMLDFGTQSSLTIQNVSAATLASHAQDFKLHA